MTILDYLGDAAVWGIGCSIGAVFVKWFLRPS